MKEFKKIISILLVVMLLCNTIIISQGNMNSDNTKYINKKSVHMVDKYLSYLKNGDTKIAFSMMIDKRYEEANKNLDMDKLNSYELKRIEAGKTGEIFDEEYNQNKIKEYSILNKQNSKIKF